MSKIAHENWTPNSLVRKGKFLRVGNLKVKRACLRRTYESISMIKERNKS